MKRALSSTFKAFRSRNYRLYFFGQSISLIGTWMQRTAVYWVIYVQTHSAFMLGVAVFATQFPSFLLSLIGGVVADRYNRYRVLLITQVASMIQAALLTLLVLFTKYTVAEILILSVVLGIINAFDVPARQSMVYDMVDDKEDLSNAIALNSTMVNLARLIGPATSGIILEACGAGFSFMLNALSFIAVIGSLLFMRLPKYIPPKETKKVMDGLKEGLRYLKATPAISTIIIMMGCSSLMVLPYVTLLPVIAKVILKGNASTYGYLNGFIGIGAIGGAIFLASLKTYIDLRKLLFITTLVFGAGLLCFSHSTYFPLALFFAIIAGFGMMSQVTLVNTILQTSVSTGMRGRVISYFAMAFFGMQPLGALLIGSISNQIGAPIAILGQGVAAILIAFFFFPYLWKNDKPEEKL